MRVRRNSETKGCTFLGVQYLGGKARLSAKIAAIIEAGREQGEPLYDVFCGTANVIAACSSIGPRIAIDGCRPLIAMLSRMQAGTWSPPESVSEADHKRIKSLARRVPKPWELADPMWAFAGFGCSFGGIWCDTFARDPKNGRNFAGTARRKLLATIERCADVEFRCVSQIDLPELSGTVYCDPPYAGTPGYRCAPPFDGVAFWRWAERQAERCRAVFVSEYTAPDGWREVASWEIAAGGRVPKSGIRASRFEKLFTR